MLHVDKINNTLKNIFFGVVLTGLGGCLSSGEYKNFDTVYVIPDSTYYVKLIEIPNNTRSVIPITKEMLLGSDGVNRNKTFTISDKKITAIFSSLDSCKVTGNQKPNIPLDLRRGILLFDKKNETVGSIFIEKTYPFLRNARLLVKNKIWSVNMSNDCIVENVWMEAFE